MEPVVDAEEGGDWVCTIKKEVFTVSRNGLAQLDYLFGVEVGDSYTWKSVTFAMGTRHVVDQITFSYTLASGRLKISSQHSIVRNQPRAAQNALSSDGDEEEG